MTDSDPEARSASTLTQPVDGVGPAVRGRVVTDHRITQLEWWSQRMTVLPPLKGQGTLASMRGAARAVWRSLGCDAFVSANVRNALVLGLFKRLTGRRRPYVVMTEMRLDDQQASLRWQAKVRLQRFAYGAVNAFCVSSRREAVMYAQRLRLPMARFHFIPWHTNVLQPRFAPSVGRYFFAAGRTGRDWETLAHAVTGLEASVVVVCGAADAARVAFPANVQVRTDIPYAEYRRLLEDAMAVVVPLEEHAFSSGQVVVLEAMALGKPVIASRVLGTEDYIEADRDGLLVRPHDAVDLRRAIAHLAARPAVAAALGRAGLAKVEQQHTLQQYAVRLVEITNGVQDGREVRQGAGSPPVRPVS